MNADFRIVDLYPVDDRADVGPAERRIPFEDIGAHHIDEGRHLLGRDPGFGTEFGHRPVKCHLRNIPLGSHRRDTFLQGRIGRVGDPRLDRLIETLEPTLCIAQLRAQGCQTQRMIVVARRLPFDKGGQQLLDALGREQLARQLFRHEAIQPLHADCPALAGALTLLRTARTGVIAVSARLAGAQGHAAAAVGTGGEAGQQDRPRDNTRRCRARVSGLHRGLHGIELIRVDDRFDRDRDLLVCRLGGTGLPDLAIEAVLALVGRPRQNFVKRPDAPSRPDTGAIAVLVKPADEGLHAHRAGLAIAVREQPEHEPHNVGFDRIDSEALFHLGAPLFRIDDRVAVGSLRAVPETLPRIFLHGAQGVLRVLLRLVLVEEREHLTDHDAHRIVAEVLRQADQPDAMLAQPADMVFEGEVIAGKPAEGMDEDHVEWRVTGGGHVQEPLQLRTPIVGSACAGFDELDRDAPLTRRTVCKRLPTLVGNGQLVLDLPARGNTQIQRGAQRRSRLCIRQGQVNGHGALSRHGGHAD